MPIKYVSKIKDEKGNTYTIKDANALNPTADQLTALNSGITSAKVGRMLLTPLTVTSQELVGVETGGDQIRVQLGSGLSLDGTTSPYTLTAETTSVKVVHVTSTITTQGVVYSPDASLEVVRGWLSNGYIVLADIASGLTAHILAVACYLTHNTVNFMAILGETIESYTYNTSGFTQDLSITLSTTINSLSTDKQFPTALAVKNYVRGATIGSYNSTTETLTLEIV